jgi:acyl-[acyl-carrier-protein]-phospholipid O-acyltransferase/long-chain-fatty-acid--[acyl-carrier-protein] ligase|tara:strand:- start:12701 stop:15103 length:2403 start_codon:yes stop_codon:yes gene_type:complete
MAMQEPVGEPNKRQWAGYWSMIVQQTQNAFNDKAAQFILIPLGGAVGYAVESAAGLMIAIPFVLFAPLAGWFSDRFSKRNVILGAAIAQVCILTLICFAVFHRNMPLALVGFFLLAMQSAFFSPAKIGINKELVGSKHLGFAAGVQQMMAMLAILAGQIVAGWWYDKRYVAMGSVSEKAWDAALFPLILLACISVPAVVMAISIPKVPAHGREKLSGKLLFSHFRDLGELWSDKGLRHTSFGVAYFWGFAAFINLWSVKVAKSMTAGGEGFGTQSSIFMASASLGMAIGFGFASWLLRKRIELGWVPLSGIAMTVSALVLAFLTPDDWPFLIALGLLAFFSALFLAPLNAWMQDRYPADKRGELQSAVNLQDCFGGIIAVAAIEGMIQLAHMLGMTVLAGFRMQMVVVGISCGLMSWFIIRILPADFIRLVCLAAVKTLYRIKFSGTERIPKTGGVLLLPNHVTFADSFYISAVTDRTVRFVMDETFMKSGMIRFAARLFGAVTIRRDQPLEAIRKTIEALEEGHVVALFPEGQLTRTGGLCELERGFELIVKKAKSPIFPLWVDGSWGSLFSFERGKFFKKSPYKIPYGLSIAVGEEISGKPNRKLVQAALMKTSAQAIARRFTKGGTPAQTNGYQLTQLDALPRGTELHLFEGDLNGLQSLGEFARQTKGKLIRSANFNPAAGQTWIGGRALREAIKEAKSSEIPVRFFDFSETALEPLEKENVTHLPCLAIHDQVIAMSMPHPPKPKESSLIQNGHKPGSWGKLLPGWHIENGAVFPGNLPLPDETIVDGEGFVVKS